MLTPQAYVAHFRVVSRCDSSVWLIECDTITWSQHRIMMVGAAKCETTQRPSLGQERPRIEARWHGCECGHVATWSSGERSSSALVRLRRRCILVYSAFRHSPECEMHCRCDALCSFTVHTLHATVHSPRGPSTSSRAWLYISGRLELNQTQQTPESCRAFAAANRIQCQ